MNNPHTIFWPTGMRVLLFAVALMACHNKADNKNAPSPDNSMNMPMPATPQPAPAAANVLPATADVLPATAPNTDTSALLSFIVKPTNEYVRSRVPLASLQRSTEAIGITALGRVEYDMRHVGAISARVSGRIEKLYVRFRYQKVRAGQKIMDLYSPEIVTAEENLLFLVKNDAGNGSLIDAAKNRLSLLGMGDEQLNRILRTRQPELTISLYSPYNGHIHEAGAMEANIPSATGTMRDISTLTEELSLKEGMYVQKGQPILNVYDPNRARVILNFYSDDQALIRTGNPVRIIPETAPENAFTARIDFIEPFYRKEGKTLTARVYFDNTHLQIPIGSQVNATVTGNTRTADWLPETAVVSLGLDKAAFIKQGIGFKAHKIATGLTYNHKIEVLEGLTAGDTVAANAQYLMDSESFIKVKE